MRKKRSKGFSLIEILIVVAILAILSLSLFLSFTRQRQRAEDTKIKADLERLKIAFEEYYNDNHCYPPPTWFDGPEDCGSDKMKPYLNAIACDDHTGLPYVLETDPTGCGTFKLYGHLSLPSSDPQALALCDPAGSNLGNYGVSSSGIRVKIACTNTPIPSAPASPAPSGSNAPSPSPFPSGFVPPPVQPEYKYYCQVANNCTSYDPYKFYCVPAHMDANCGGGCTAASACIERQKPL